MDFNRYLEEYLKIKRLRGITPGQNTSTALFAPYFNQAAARNIEGRRLDLAERAQTSREKQQTESLAWDKERTEKAMAWAKEKALNELLTEKWYQGELKKQAGRQDKMQLISNIISGAGAFAKWPLYKRLGYL